MVDVPTDSAVITTDVTIDYSTDSKRESRLDQLSKARESAKQKKRQRDEDIADMKQKLDSISESLKSTTTNEATPVPEIEQVKRQRVTKVVEDVHDTQDDSWSTSLIRTTAVISLGAISWYMQNMYGTSKARPPLESSLKKKNENETKTPQTTMLSVRDKISTAVIGRSGFVS